MRREARPSCPLERATTDESNYRPRWYIRTLERLGDASVYRDVCNLFPFVDPLVHGTLRFAARFWKRPE